MNQQMEQILNDEATKYAIHYFEGFLSKAESNHPKSFQDHFKELKFDKGFYYGFIYEEQPFLQYLDEKRSEIIRKSKSEEKMLEANDEIEKELLKETNKVYKSHFASVYLEQLNEKLDDYLEELTFATEDAVYYRERKYIGEENEIGGEVSEEERLHLMEENERNIDRYTNLIEKLKEAKIELERYAFVQV
jgi:hypothetical protein